MSGAYCDSRPTKAIVFSTYAQAYLFNALGFAAQEIDGSYGKASGLQNATGDWISSLTAWWEHDPRALQAYRAAMVKAARRHEVDQTNWSFTD